MESAAVSGPLPGFLLLHIGTQHRIHAPLITRALSLEIIKDIFIDSDRYRLLSRWCDKNHIRPVETLHFLPVRIPGDRRLDLFIGQSIEGFPISFAPAMTVSRDDGNIFVFPRDSRAAPR